MIAISDEQIIKLAKTASERGQLAQARALLLRLANPPRDMLSEVTYRLAKETAADAEYQSARDLFVEAAERHPDKATRCLAQERSSLIKRISRREQMSAKDCEQMLSQIRADPAELVRPDMLQPEIEFVACPAAYRSGWDRKASDPLSTLIRLMKKGVEEDAVHRLGAFLAVYIQFATPSLRSADFVIPVPTQAERLTQRGYSIPTLLAEDISRMCAVPLHDELVRATGGALELRSVPRWYRKHAIAGAFDVGKKAAWLDGRDALIVDDVMTTGSTMRELARVLRAHGAERVDAVALAHTEWSS
jgi:predicted amidophosphoribosyltransferase